MTILREITREKHLEVENLPLIQKLLNGELSKDQYVSYLYELYFLYGVIERCADFCGHMHEMTDIHRFNKIKMDIDELNFGYSHKLCDSSIEYSKYLMQLCNDNPKNVFAHVYVRHMGDLYGGKLISRLVPGSGNCYMFEDRPKIIKQFNSKLEESMGEEANIAFTFFIKIFTELGTKILDK